MMTQQRETVRALPTAAWRAACLASTAMILFAAPAVAQTTAPGQDVPPATSDQPIDATAATVQSSPDSAQASDEPEGGLADIIVTAEKRATGASLQRVPAAISAINMAALAETQATTLVDVGRLAPNVQFQTSAAFPGIANFTIRGLSLNSSLRTLDPTVTIVVDGMPYADPLATILDTFDVESIEILRGPQGVLIGRNATGGAVLLRTRRPPTNFEFEANVRVGNGGRLDQAVYVGGPIAGDTVRAKMSVVHRFSNGLSYDNNSGRQLPAPGNPTGAVAFNAEEDQVGEDTWIFRPAITVESGAFQATLIGELIDTETGGNNSRPLFAQPVLINQFGYTPPPFSYEIDHNGRDGYEMVTKRVSLEATYDVGVGVITSATGYRTVRVDGDSDNDGTPFTLFHFPDNTNRGDQFSQELRFSSTFSDRLTLLFGGYYSDLFLDSTEFRAINTLLISPNPPFNQIFQYGEYTQKSHTLAAFGNVDFEIVNSLTLSAGLRYTYEKKQFDIAPIRGCAGPGPTNCQTTRAQNERSFDNLSPRFAISWQATPDILAYASYTKGFRSGNYNGRATSLLGATASDPELAKSYEAGIKSTFFDRRARLNLAAFNTDYDNIQKVLTGSDAVQRVLNVASARIYGAEAELSVQPFDGFQLDGAFGWTHARYQEFNSLDLTGDGVPDPAIAKNLKFERVPEFQYTVAGTYKLALGDAGDVTFKSSYAWVDHLAVEVTNVAALEVPAHGIWDASVSYAPDDRLRFTAFAKNISNIDYWDIGVNYRWGPTVSGGEARSYGLEMGLRF